MERATVDRYETGARSNMTYRHVPRTSLPLELADLHRGLAPGAPVDVQVLYGPYDGHAGWTAPDLRDLLIGAGFDVTRASVEHDVVQVSAGRAMTLADTVGGGMRLLVCGLNPSIYSAERGVGFARPGNRFWPAVIEAGLVSVDRDARHALAHHGVGMTDLCKRATVASAELSAAEYRTGAERVKRLVRWLQPGAVCFVGLEGWRAAVDRKAVAGVQPVGFGGRPAYVVPSTSGRNARCRLPDLVTHFRAAAGLADTF
ncbi:MAG TPA: mismatch-specific DNA-glycosylase [Acidimicrobiales bacterium]|nr:mismatch-specific DNA-glycosylase [Acidimicrobiales bacterium]